MPQTRTLPRDALLFRQGDPALAIFRVASGTMRLERGTADGRRVVLHTARTGEFFAEASLFAESYHCDAVAVAASRVEVLSKAAVLADLGPAGAPGGLVEAMARGLQGARMRLELRNVRSARERVLLGLELKADAARVVEVEGAWQDLAAELGLTREALYRTLAALEREGLIRRAPGHVVLLSGT